MFDQPVDKRRGNRIDRGAIPAWCAAGHRHMHFEGAFEQFGFDVVRMHHRVFVHPRMMPDLVAIFENRFDGIRVGLHHPCRHEKGLGQAEAAIGVQNAGHGDCRPVAPHRDRLQPEFGIIGAGGADQ